MFTKFGMKNTFNKKNCLQTTLGFFTVSSTLKIRHAASVAAFIALICNIKQHRKYQNKYDIPCYQEIEDRQLPWQLLAPRQS